MPPPPDSPHAELAPRKRRRKRDDPQSFFTNSEDYESDEGSPVSCSDVESFQGKIVYNPDGSAYIIDSENDSLSNISETGLAAGLPAVNNPKIHSFRVVTARDATINKICEPNKIQKPILMCFICKLSFGNTKSFSLHANSEHTLNLHESEKLLLNREYSSAIIQRNIDEKPQISFLEPLDVHKQLFQQHQQQMLNSSNMSASSTPPAPSEFVSTTTTIAIPATPSCTIVSSSASNNLCSILMSKSTISSQMMDATTVGVTAPSSSSLSSATLSSSVPSSCKQQVALTTPISSLNLNNTNKLNNDSPSSTALVNSNAVCSSSNVTGQNLSDFVQQQLKQQQQQSLQRASTPSPTQQMPSLGLTSNSPTSTRLSNTNNNNNDSSNIHSNPQQSSPKPTPSSTSNVSSFLSSAAVGTSSEGNNGTNSGDLNTSNNNNSSSNSAKLLNEFLQQQQQHQQQQLSHNLTCPEHQGFKFSGQVDCKSCELINITNLKSSPMTPTKSPNSINLTTPSSSASLTSISPTTPAPSFTIGACPDHINGRPIGVDCARCEMILNSARLNSGSQISTRNSCKTLKCPQCNWHYKYQETLEIHMREKHPDGESACGYCLAGQQHPRLARGESYTCGYKPYRCEICNYSTTTKGNLSIHMQSDKHLNNMQELNSSQNLSSSNDIRENPKIVMPNMPQQTSKPKPSFRCDVCSYETSVARNLRIHMTSEKHTHNMAVLQNNMKHFQALSFLQSQNLGAAAAANMPNLNNMPSLQQNMPNLQNFLPEAALADLAYNQALMIQLLHQNSAAGALGAAAAAAAAAASIPQSQQQQPPSPAISQQLSSNSSCPSTSNQLNSSTVGSSSSSAPASNAAAVAAAALLGSSLEPDQGLNLESMEPPIEPDQRPTTVFSCLICSAYNTNNIDELNNHLMIDRSRNSSSSTSNCNSDIMLIINNNYICRLCNYKTNLKANFQLHSKTDKHIQKLNYINHIKEGGPKNEYKLKYNNTNTIQLKCNCCDFYTNSIQKLNLHSQHMRHDTMKMIFNHLVYIDQMYSIQQHRRASTSTPTSGINQQQTSNDSNQRLNSTSGNSDSDPHQQQIGSSGSLSTVVESSGVNSGGSILVKQSQQQQLIHSIICELCNYKAATVLQMIQHVKSIRHVQVEQFICLQRRSENLEPLELSDVFKIIEGGKSEKCSPINSPVDTDLIGSLSSGQTSTPIPRLGENSDEPSSSLGVLQTPSSLPMSSSMTTLMKCNNCDYFCENKQEIEMHIENMHPNCMDDYLSIPANSMALHAFQAAMAAATAAAAKAIKPSPSPLPSNTGIDSSVTPTSLDEIKSERMDADMESIGDGTEVDQQDLDGIEASEAHSATSLSVPCPLCQDSFNDRKSLETHVMGVHSVNNDGLTRLLQLVDTSHWLNSTNKRDNDDTNSERNHTSNNSGALQARGDEIECTQCGQSVKSHQELLMHAQEMQHYTSVNDQYHCLLKQCHQTYNSLPTMIAHFKDTHMNIVISERHVYKYRCKQCSLAFKTQEKLNTHSLYHTMRDATKCMICNRSFRSTQSLQKHMEQAHNHQQTSGSPSPPPNEQEQPKSVPVSSKDDYLASQSPIVKQDDDSGHAHDLMLREDQLILHHGSLLDCSNPTSEMDEYLNAPQIAEETYNDPNRKHKCHKCKMAFTHQHFLALHYKSNHHHRRNEKLNNYPMEKYLDPNRPFKCEICLESFTQKNILLVHYNSVSHLHKLKKQSENNNTPSSSPSNNPSPMDCDRKSVDSDRRSVERDRKSVDLDLEILNEQHKRKLSPENDYDSPKKRFKCDICKVAYAQGSTLDIHMRSVLHQTRACRLQEQQQQQQIQQQLTPSLTSSLARIVEQHQQQQQLQQSISPAPSNLSGVQDDPNMPKFNNQIYKTLLENFGFDIVKQFNELKHTGGEMSREQLNDEKYFCRHCKKTFSSIFVLKSHCEEIHNDKIPLDVLEKFAEKFKNYYLETSDIDSEILDFSAKKMSPDPSHSPNSSLNDSSNAHNMCTKDSPSIQNQPPTTPVYSSALSPSPHEASPSSQQQQPTIKSQQLSVRQSPESQIPTSIISPSQSTSSILPTDLAQKFNIDPTMLAQKIMEQNLATVPSNFANLPQNLQSIQNLQSLQNLQNLQNLPNMPNLPMNTLDMLSLMQFHHLMSLNFMNLAPPLIFGATGAAAAAAAIAGGSVPPVTPELPVNPNHQVQLLQQQAAAAAQATNNQKRARTRITDEQLKILRAHFDINNSPSEESIMEMSKKANLPMKVVKHWFRNTLFKERQRNKDSPYNFNNPPSTTLNLEEYERTGHAKVTSLVEQGDPGQHMHSQQQSSQNQQRQQHSELQAQFHQQQQQQHQQMSIDNRPLSQPSSTASERGGDMHIKSEPNDDLNSYDPDQQSLPQHSHHQLQHSVSHMMKHDQHDHDSSGASGNTFQQSQHQQHMFYNNFETKSESGSSEILSRPQSPNNASFNNLNDMANQQMDPASLGSLSSGPGASPAGAASLAGVVANLNNMGPPKKFQINKIFDKSNFETNSNSSNSSSSSGKRANRTRFTDYQIKVLQEFFENNSYPKDSDLEYLSKLLLLSPRVIVVWFQNARQKQRKIYENQPNNSFYESEDKKPNINYTCKKCNLVFQRYYELIRHQKNHCFKEENNKKSAKAQIAAAQIAQSLSSEDSNSSIDVNSANLITSNLAAQQAAAAAAAAAAIGSQVPNLGLAQSSTSSSSVSTSLTAIPGLSTSPGLGLLASPHGLFGKHTSMGSGQNSASASTKDGQSPQKFECDKCNLTFSRFELFKEHQLIHIMNPNLFLNQSYAENTPFGILQNMQNNLMSSGSGSGSNLLMGPTNHDASIDLSQSSSKRKRKFSETLPQSETPVDDIQAMIGMQVPDYDMSKKLKSEQYDFLFQYFMQNEPNEDIKKQYQEQQQHQSLDIEYLTRFYQMNELKKKGNYDFFYQYYLQNEGKHGDGLAMLDNLGKPNLEFLLQYYQLNECKKFFQLGASPQTVHDFPLLNLTTMTSASDANSVKATPTQQHLPNSADIEDTTTSAQIVSGGGNATLKETFPATGRGKTPTPNSTTPNTPTTIESSASASMISSPTHAAAVVAATILAAGGSGVIGQKTRQDQQKHMTTIIGGNSLNTNNCPPVSNANTCLQVNAEPSNLPKNQNQLISSSPNPSIQSSPPLIVQSAINDFNNTNSLTFSNLNPMKTPTNSMPGVGGVEHVTTMEKQTNKRLRTTILPEQLNFLYECYQNESNPSRKMLEEISKKVNLKKRVVQVWYQNSRARERKGQFRQNLQIINKKCPHCGAIFKIKSALESHLQTKHPEKQPINIDQIPDVTQKPVENSGYSSTHGLNAIFSQTRPPTPTSTTGNAAATNPADSCVPSDLNQHIQGNHQPYQNDGPSCGDDFSTLNSNILDSVNNSVTVSQIGTPLDLSKSTPKYEPSESDVSFSDSNNEQDESNDFFLTSSSTATNIFNSIHNNNNNSNLNNNHVKIADLVNYRHHSNNSPTTTCANLTSASSPVGVGDDVKNIGENRLGNNHLNDLHYDSDAASNMPMATHQQNRDLSILFNNDNGADMDRSPASPASSTQSLQKKRFRTQMSNIQVRILRTLFTDVKTPTMNDCENVGQEIGLPKRVVQVWFQNARAKEKKSKNSRSYGDDNFEQNANNELSTDATVALTEDCRLCNVQKANMQEHVFSAGHIAKVRLMLENGDHLIGYSGSESNDQPDTTEQSQLNVKSKSTKLSTPPTSGRESPSNSAMNPEQNLSVYNQLLMQNPMFAAAAAATSNQGLSNQHFGEQDGKSHAAITAAAAMMNFNHIKQRLVAVQQQQQSHQNQSLHNSDENIDNCHTTNAAHAVAASAAHRLLMENNLLLQINADQTLSQAGTDSEALLQQIYNYNQMSEHSDGYMIGTSYHKDDSQRKTRENYQSLRFMAVD